MLIPVIVLRDMPEHSLRGLGQFEYGSSSEQKLKRALNKGNWLYSSFNAQVGAKTLERLRSTGLPERSDYEDFFGHQGGRTWTEKLTGQWFLLPVSDEDPSYQIQIDELLLPNLKEPKLVKVIRMQRDLPKYPKPITQSGVTEEGYPQQFMPTSPR